MTYIFRALYIITFFVGVFLQTSLLSAQENPALVYRYGLYAGTIDRFPNTEGIGWADSIAYEIFSQAGYTIDIITFPARRLPLMLSSNEIDSFPLSKESLDRLSGNFLLSKYPLSVITWKIYYNNQKNWKPVWPPDDIFRQKIGKSKQSSISLKEGYGLNISQSDSFLSTIKMVNLGRVDYWIDNESGMKSFREGDRFIAQKGFVFETIFRRGLYLVFLNTERGRKLNDIFSTGVEKLIREGNFAKVFYKNDKYMLDTHTADDTMIYIQKKFPLMEIPDQLGPIF